MMKSVQIISKGKFCIVEPMKKGSNASCVTFGHIFPQIDLHIRNGNLGENMVQNKMQTNCPGLVVAKVTILPGAGICQLFVVVNGNMPCYIGIMWIDFVLFPILAQGALKPFFKSL